MESSVDLKSSCIKLTIGKQEIQEYEWKSSSQGCKGADIPMKSKPLDSFNKGLTERWTARYYH